MDPMAEIKQTFFLECEDLLVEMEEGLLEMESGGADSETVNAVFRAVHSIKGGAGAFSLDVLVKFAHTFETALDEVRSDRLEADAEVMKIFLRSADLLADLVRAAREDEEPDEERSVALIDDLTELAGISEDDDEDIDFEPMGLDFDLDDDGDSFAEADAPSLNFYNITFKPHKELYTNGNETILLMRELERLGKIDVSIDIENIPFLDQFDPDEVYTSWKIRVETESESSEIWDVFEFVEGACDLEIEEEEAAENDPLAAFECDDEDQDTSEDTGAEINLEGTDTPANEQEIEVESTAEKPQEDAAPAPVAEKKEPPKAAEAAKKATPTQATVRVDLNRVDRLINLVGELVINQAMLSQCAIETGLARATAVESRLDELKQLTRELQESVMAIRAQPVKPLFQRMSRIVREAADATDKAAKLVTEGENTEIDKTVIERLADPLTHMIRNAIDHGLESTEKRLEAGKTEHGNVFLTAAHRSGRVVIEVSDDGGGINRERVRQIAIDKGLITPDIKLTDNEIDNLIFAPGFSTAKEVSNLSGRGVGMDVVKRSIQSLGGKVSITSTPGKGSTFTISLPLTLAILDGMVVQIQDETLVVPLTAIVETWKPEGKEIEKLGPGANVICIRGEYTPLIDVGMALGYRNEPADPQSGVIISVESNESSRCALIVDSIQDQRQVVIKSLEENYGNVPYVAAATILGDGRIALILDVDAISETNTGPGNAIEDNTLVANG